MKNIANFALSFFLFFGAAIALTGASGPGSSYDATAVHKKSAAAQSIGPGAVTFTGGIVASSGISVTGTVAATMVTATPTNCTMYDYESATALTLTLQSTYYPILDITSTNCVGMTAIPLANNMVRSSENPGVGAGWTRDQVTGTADAIPGPTGWGLSDLLDETASYGTHRVYQGAVTYVENDVIIQTAIVKPYGNTTWFSLVHYGNVSFNLATCTVGTIYTANTVAIATDLGGGWCKIRQSRIVAFGGTSSDIRFYGAQGDNVLDYMGAPGNGFYMAMGSVTKNDPTDTYCGPTTNATPNYCPPSIQVVTAGQYLLNMSVSMTASADNQLIEAKIYQNETGIDACSISRKIATGADEGAASISCIAPLIVGDKISGRFSNSTSAGASISPTHYNITAHRLN